MKIIALALLMFTPFPLSAGNGAQLSDLKVDKEKAYGTCGPAKITVEGLTQSDASGHSNVIAPEGSISVRTASKVLRLGQSEPFFLQDRTMLACMDTPKGKRLVVATFCDGRSCEPVEYAIVDPSNADLLSPRNGISCTSECAVKLIGDRLPAPLHEGR